MFQPTRYAFVCLAWFLVAVPKLAADEPEFNIQHQSAFRSLPEINLGQGETYSLTARGSTHRECDKKDPPKCNTKYELFYNSKFAGTQINVRPGQTMNIRVINRLPGFDVKTLEDLDPPLLNKNEPESTKQLLAASSSMTNLHTHGLHVSPGERSDNVMLQIPSGKDNVYTIELPEDHAPGTHWYHAHLHGATALQVQGGLVGALIVEPLQAQHSLNPPGYTVATEVLVLQFGTGWKYSPKKKKGVQESGPLTVGEAGQISELIAIETEDGLKDFLNRLDEPELEALKESLSDRFQLDIPPLLVNGQERSFIELPQDLAVRRLRVVNTGSRQKDYKKLWIENAETKETHPMYLAAFDGVNLTKLPKDAQGRYIAYNKDNKLALGAGNRADIFFIPSDPGTFELKMQSEIGLRDEAGPTKIGLAERMNGTQTGKRPRQQFERTLMTFDVVGEDIPDASAADPQRFLRDLDGHLKKLQSEIPAYSTGYLRPFTDHSKYIQRRIVFNTKGYNKKGQSLGQGKHSFEINRRSYNRPRDDHHTSENIPRGGHDHMGGHSDYLGKVTGDGGRGPGENGSSPWPLRSGTEEEWTIVNTSTQPHTFHVHVSPFWIVNIVEGRGGFGQKTNCDKVKGKFDVRKNNPNDPRLDRWQDTVILPPCGSVTVRHRVSRFTGLYVIHCHILQHEDRGMMLNVLTVSKEEEDPQAFFEGILKRNRQINQEINH